MGRLNRVGRLTLICMALYCLAGLAACAVGHAAESRRLQNMSGNDLYRYCTVKSAEPLALSSAMVCLGYLTAILDVLSSGAPVAGKRACVPASAEEDQVVDITTGYIRAHPEIRHLAALWIVGQAFAASFPCR